MTECVRYYPKAEPWRHDNGFHNCRELGYQPDKTAKVVFPVWVHQCTVTAKQPPSPMAQAYDKPALFCCDGSMVQLRLAKPSRRSNPTSRFKSWSQLSPSPGQYERSPIEEGRRGISHGKQHSREGARHSDAKDVTGGAGKACRPVYCQFGSSTTMSASASIIAGKKTHPAG